MPKLNLHEKYKTKILLSFAKMLNLQHDFEIKPDDNQTKLTSDELDSLELLIKQKLDSGAKAQTSHDNITPLMLYICFHIDDDRFDQELFTSEEYLKTLAIYVPDNKDEDNFRVSAINLCAVTNNIKALDKLYHLFYLSPQDIGEMVFYAVIAHNLEILQWLNKYKVDLFGGYFTPKGITTLHVASWFGYPEIIKELLACHTCEEIISYKPILGVTAYECAVYTEREECIDLFKTTNFYIWEQIQKAILTSSLTDLSAILEQCKEKKMLWTRQTLNDYRSLIGLAYAIVSKNDTTESRQIMDYVESYMKSCSKEDQINALLIGLDYPIHNNFEIKIINQLRELSSDFNKLTVVCFDGLKINEELFELIKPIFKLSPLVKIEFTAICPDFYDTETDDVYTGSLSEKFAFEFVVNLLHSTSLQTCYLSLRDKHELYCELIYKLTERNKKMAFAEYPIAQDAIFNQYIPVINELMHKIKSSLTRAQQALWPAPLRLRQNRMYSLQELTAFPMANRNYLAELGNVESKQQVLRTSHFFHLFGKLRIKPLEDEKKAKLEKKNEWRNELANLRLINTIYQHIPTVGRVVQRGISNNWSSVLFFILLYIAGKYLFNDNDDATNTPTMKR